ncbi:hypothetical protein WJX75_008791 [Coccomyxa subellipsoidea]|uniref:Disease resistance protein Roq1-like winged-helix domain-containing protein n=1 Tax=Coccomyxa subellipsoidea TaxID=248742 RepID=A0ABR2YCP5_9CHLO
MALALSIGETADQQIGHEVSLLVLQALEMPGRSIQPSYQLCQATLQDYKPTKQMLLLRHSHHSPSSSALTLQAATPPVRMWTLQELHWALRSKDSKGAKVYPVFYGVSPDDKAEVVRKMEAWLQSKGIDPSSCIDDVARLFRITGLRSEAKDGFEPAMVEEVVRNILAELQRTPLYLPLDLVGMDNRVQGALDYLQTNDGSQAVKVLGVYGPGGSGKSTLAKALYNHLYIDFPGRHAFIELGQDSSPSYLSGRQATLLSVVFNHGREVTIPSVAQGQQSLCDSTTTGGKVVGAYLHQKEDITWTEITDQLQSLGDLGTDDAILQSLMLSYDRLKPGLQTVFLDVAVMLMGADRKYAEWILQGARGRNAGSAHIDLDALIDLSLLECDASGSMRMHDTLADMARYIISQPGRSPAYLALDDRAGIQQDIGAPKAISRLRYRGKELPEKLLTATHEMDRLVLVDLEAYRWAQESVSLQRAPQGLQHLAYLRVIGAERFPDAFVDPGSGLPALIALDLAHLGGPGGAADIPNLTGSVKLKVLRLRNCQIKGHYLSALGNMSQLRQMIVQHDLDLSGLPSSLDCRGGCCNGLAAYELGRTERHA